MTAAATASFPATRRRLDRDDLLMRGGICLLIGWLLVTLAIRPEDVVVRNTLATNPNTFMARVADVEFLGSFCRVGLAINGSDSALVADFSINVVRDLLIEENKELLIALPPERLRVFPRAPQTP